MLEEPLCRRRCCKHFKGVLQPDGTEASEVCVCPAFPKGIPDRIAYGSDKHLQISSDQVGNVVYEKYDMHEEQIVDAIGKARKGITQYLAILDTVHRVDVSHDRDFQKMFNRFYRVRQRSAEWYEVYFRYLENSKIAPPSFDAALDYLWSTLGRYEPSFSSKLVATLVPDQPIWDRFVLENTRIEAPSYAARNRVHTAKTVYRSIEKWYSWYLHSAEGHRILRLFNREVEEHGKISDLKKVDFVLWQTRA